MYPSNYKDFTTDNFMCQYIGASTWSNGGSWGQSFILSYDPEQGLLTYCAPTFRNSGNNDALTAIIMNIWLIY